MSRTNDVVSDLRLAVTEAAMRHHLNDDPSWWATLPEESQRNAVRAWAELILDLVFSLREARGDAAVLLERLAAVEPVVKAVLYAMRVGCFFPVPEPTGSATLRELIQWGAMRGLHQAVAGMRSNAREVGS